MAEVKSHSTLFNNLSNSQNVQILENIVNQAGADIETIPELAPSYTDVKQDLTSLDGAFRHGKALYETKEVAGKDSGRDYITRSIASRVASYANYPQSEQEKEEAGRLQFIVDTYKNADRKEYESETTFIRRFIVELRKYPALLVKYGINTMVDNLEIENNAFDEAFNLRSEIRLSIEELGKMQSLRRKVNNSFGRFTKAINGMLYMPFPDDVKAKLDKIIGIININIDEFKEIYHRHAGIVSKHHKKDDNNGDDNKPGGGSQKPDNTKPPAPDTPPQNPNVTPPTVNPDDLNPPAVGEH